MELKRSLTKRMLNRQSAPGTIELPEKRMPASSFGEPVTPTSSSSTALPHTPRTPTAKEFVSIPFEGVSPGPHGTVASAQGLSTPPRSAVSRSARSSRSGSVASVNVSTATWVSPFGQVSPHVHHSTAHSVLQPPLELKTDQSWTGASAGTPVSPDSEVESEAADEMAQEILAKVQEGQYNWSL